MVKKIGVLGLQGSFKEHLAAIARVGGEVEGVDVRTPAELATVDALIIPGGESTAIAVGLEDSGLLEPVRAFCAQKPVWGICAGLILLADQLEDKTGQSLIGGLPITVKRNAFGRQIDSRFRAVVLSKEAPAHLGTHGYFIRAPAITAKKGGVKVLASVTEGAVAVSASKKLATCFHPEISGDDSWLRHFLTDVCGIKLAAAAAPLPPVTCGATRSCSATPSAVSMRWCMRCAWTTSRSKPTTASGTPSRGQNHRRSSRLCSRQPPSRHTCSCSTGGRVTWCSSTTSKRSTLSPQRTHTPRAGSAVA